MTKVKNMMLSIVILGAICCLLLAGPAWAGTTWLQKQKLLASDGAAGDILAVLFLSAVIMPS